MLFAEQSNFKDFAVFSTDGSTRLVRKSERTLRFLAGVDGLFLIMTGSTWGEKVFSVGTNETSDITENSVSGKHGE